MHDGAALIRDERIAAASCLLPLSGSTLLQQQYGTRHRAALGLAECTDAVALVVSEERGTVSLAVQGAMTAVENAAELQAKLEKLLLPREGGQRVSPVRRLFSNLLPKVAIFLGVTAIWLLLSVRQGEVAIVPASLTLHGLPEGMSLVRVAPEEVAVRVRSTSALAPSLRQLNLTVDLDLADVQDGNNQVRVQQSLVRVPSGIVVVGVEPAVVRVTVRTVYHKK